ncbi:MAG: HRDC domain-containing protein [Planctomycetaceae bacterium]|nr:HRDC domain-containing protein [Planctomycetaceae bacterium]
MSYISATRPSELRTLIRHISDSPWIALDTEFIAEKKFQSQLCLVQVAAEDIIGIIDPQSVEGMTPFWEFLCDGDKREVLMHACRSEMEFCYRAVRRVPHRVFDVQLAAGLAGNDYPASFSTLLERHLHVSLPKAETRTDWARRPLTERQIDYALNDVRYLNPLAKKLKKQLSSLKRVRWYQSEIRDTLDRLVQDFDTPKWRSLSGLNSLSRRELAIVRELCFWRDQQARQHNIPVGLLMRDDLVIELARRKSPDPKRISAVRGLQRNDITRQLPYISAAIQRGLDCPEEVLPEPLPKQKTQQYTQMVQLLYSGLAMLCHRNDIATSIVATQSDVRELIAARFGESNDNGTSKTLKLEQGWRAMIVGCFLDDLLDGKVAIRIDKYQPNSPLQFVDYPVPHSSDYRMFDLD